MPRLTKEQARIWNEAQEYGDDNAGLIRELLLTRSQEKWMKRHELSIEDILSGQYPCNLESEVIKRLYKLWNGQVDDKVVRQVRDKVQVQVWDRIREQVWVQIRDQVFAQVQDGINADD